MVKSFFLLKESLNLNLDCTDLEEGDSMLNKNLKDRFNSYLVGFALVLCGLLFLNSYYQHSQLEILNSNWIEKSKEEPELSDLLEKVNRNMGFGGYSHYLQKYKTSKELQHKMLAISKAENTVSSLSLLAEKANSPEITTNIEIIKNNIKKQIEQINNEHYTNSKDKDFDSIKALEEVSKAIKARRKLVQDEHSRIIQKFQTQIIYSNFALGLLIVFLIYISILKVNRDHQNIDENLQILNFVQNRSGESWWTWQMLKDEMEVSKSFWKALGYKKPLKKIHFSEWQNLVHPDDLEQCMEHFKMHWESEGSYPIQQTLRMKHKSGHWIHFLTNIAVIEWSKDKSPVKMMGAHSNVNKLVVTQQELAQEKERKSFYEKLSAVSHLAGSIAHEINNPLAILSGHSRILKTLTLKNRVESKTFLESIDTMDQTILRIGNIIKSLRSLTRDNSQTEIQNFSLKDLIDEVVVLCQDRASRTDCYIDTELTQGIFVSGRRTQIGQVFINLFNNSFSALRELDNRWIRIEALDLHDKTVIYFTDSGNGIPEKDQNQIMEAFFTTKKTGESTGIGLSTNKSIIDLHSGEFYLNTSSENTSFVIELPKVSNSNLKLVAEENDQKISS